MRILTISGCLRSNSSNAAVLNALALIAPPDMTFVAYQGLSALPHFNPDLEDHLPTPVQALRSLVAASSGIVISTPEYAHGVPGALKNLLDWLVGGVELEGKAVALISTSPRPRHAQEQLQEILRTMSAQLVVAASVEAPLLRRRLSPADIVADPELRAGLERGLLGLRQAALTSDAEAQCLASRIAAVVIEAPGPEGPFSPRP